MVTHPEIFIREWRKHRGLTIDELASRIDVAEMTLSRWERSARRITLDTLEVLANELDCTTFDLIYRPPDGDLDIAKALADLPEEKKKMLETMVTALLDDQEIDNQEKKSSNGS